uniref:SNF7 family protein n=1 Tax=Taenia asiatica TaxID=60517 RepID=A0A0R3WFJ3_TAEAS
MTTSRARDLRPNVRDLPTRLRRKHRKLDRDIVSIQQKCKQREVEAQKYTKNVDATNTLVKEIVASPKSANRLYRAKAQIDSVIMELENQVAMAKMASALNQSTSVMQTMSKLVKLPELCATMCNMWKGMMRLGLMNEMVEESTDSALDQPEQMEEMAQAEVDKILFQLTNGAMGMASDAVTDTLPACTQRPVDVDDDDLDDREAMRARLQAIH